MNLFGLVVLLGIIAGGVAFAAGAFMNNSQAFWWSLVLLGMSTFIGLYGQVTQSK
jgi:hypothetical protein